MIIGFVGTPGSGKTYEAVKKILDNIRLGRKIYTNIDGLDLPPCREAIKSYSNITDYQLETVLNFLTRDQAEEFWLHCEKGSLVVIDEVHKLFSNRDWATEKNKDFCEWASTHRHEGFDVVLITQDIEKIDKHARSLIEWCYLFRKVNFFGGTVQKKYLCYAYAGENHYGKPLQKNIRHYSADVFRCYKSYASDDIKELGFMTHANILRHPIFFAIPIVLSISLYLFFTKSSFATGDVFGSKAIVATAQQKIEQQETADQTKTEPTDQPTDQAPDPEIEQPAPNLQPTPADYPSYTVIRRYLLPDGRIFYTNTDRMPSGSVPIRN